MKRILGIIMLTAVFTCCDVGVRQSSASGSTLVDDPSSRGIQVTLYQTNGMEYKIFSMYNGGMHIVNVTKDKLEVELLQLQIDSLKR